MLKRLTARLGVVAIVASALLILPSPPPAQALGNGIRIAQFAYVDETDPWLTDMATCPADMPAVIVLNQGNGSTNDVGYYQDVAQDIMACPSNPLVLGYVHLVDSFDEDSDSNTTELRTTTNIGIDNSRWYNAFSSGSTLKPQRTNALQMVDGIFYDQAPSTCGSSSANVLHMDAVTDNARNQAAFWGYSTAVVMANVGTAVADCHPGWQLAPYNGDGPNFYVTFEGTFATYSGSYLGGNVTNGSSYYNGFSTFGEKFVHIVYDADAAEMVDAVRMADDRGATYVAVTDDTTPNPYDTEPSYDAVFEAQKPRIVFDDGYPGIVSRPDAGGVNIAAQSFNLNSYGSSPQRGAAEVAVWDLAERECGVEVGVDPEAGSVGSSTDVRDDTYLPYYYWYATYSSLDADFVTCMRLAMTDQGQPNDPQMAICNDIYWGGSGYITTDLDCRNPDGSTTSNLNSAATAFFQNAMSTNANVENFLVLLRDRLDETANTGSGSAPCLHLSGLRCLQHPPFMGSPGPPGCITISTRTDLYPWASTRSAVWDQNGCYGLPSP